MNPLSQLPQSSSKQFSLDSIDLQKILRFLIVQILGLFVSMAPVLAGYHYAWSGVDFTPIVVVLVNTGAESIRRFLNGGKTSLPPETKEP